MFHRLHDQGVERITLCLDNDKPGRAATAKAIEAAARAPGTPEPRVIDSTWLEPHTDPDAYVRHDGTQAWQTLTTNAQCAITWRALELLDNTTPHTDKAARKRALTRAGCWLGTLPPRLALEQEDSIHALAKQCGYTPEAVARSFRARYWRPSLGRSDQSGQAAGIGR